MSFASWKPGLSVSKRNLAARKLPGRSAWTYVTPHLPICYDSITMIKQILFTDNSILYLTDEPKKLNELLGNGCFAVPVFTKEHPAEDFPFTPYAVTDIEELLETAPKDGGDLYMEGRDHIPESIRRIYRRLAGIPWDILETKRLKLREMTVADVDDFYELYRDPSITKYMEDLYEDPEDERIYTRNYIEKIYGFYGYGLWTVIHKESGKVIGRAGISNRDGFDLPELGFMLGKEYQKKGYAFEICEAILTYAKEELGFSEILSFVRPGNLSSERLLEKLGFRPESRTLLHGIPHTVYAFRSS